MQSVFHFSFFELRPWASFIFFLFKENLPCIKKRKNVIFLTCVIPNYWQSVIWQDHSVKCVILWILFHFRFKTTNYIQPAIQPNLVFGNYWTKLIKIYTSMLNHNGNDTVFSSGSGLKYLLSITGNLETGFSRDIQSL